MVLVRRNHSRRGKVGRADVASEAQEDFRRSFAIPRGTFVRGMETRFEGGALHIRVRVGLPA